MTDQTAGDLPPVTPPEGNGRPSAPDSSARASGPRPARSLATAWRRGILLAGPAIIALLLGAAMLDGLRRWQASAALVERADEAIIRAARSYSALQDAEMGQRGYLLTGDARFLAPYERALPAHAAHLAALHALTRQEPELQPVLASLDTLVRQKLALVATAIALQRDGRSAAAVELVREGRGREMMDAIREHLATIVATERATLDEHHTDEATYRRLVLVLATVGTLATVLIAILANLALTRLADGEAAQARRLREQNALLESQALELELQTTQLQEQATLLEGQTVDLRHQAAELRVAGTQTASILASAGDCILGVDASGWTTFANPAAERALGWTSAELVGHPQHELIHHSHADGRPYPANDCPLFRARQSATSTRVDDDVFWRRDGTPLPVEYEMTPIIDDGVVTGAVVSFRDVTERRQAVAEQRRLLDDARTARAEAEAARRDLQTMFAQAPAVVAVTTGPEHRFVLMNALAAQLAGRDDVIGQTFAEAFPEVAAQGFVALLDQVYTTGKPYAAHAMPVQLLDATGAMREHSLDFVYQPLRDETGAVTGIMQHAVDVTEQVEAVRTTERLLAEERASQLALAEAHTMLEQQQVELETTNQQLSENAVELEVQAEELAAAVMELEAGRDEMESATRRARFAGDVGMAITSGGSLPAMMQRCCEAAVRHLDAAFARVWVTDDAQATLHLTASAGLYTHLDGPHSRVPVGQFKIGQIAAERVPHLSNSVRDDPRVSDHAWAEREGMVAFAGYPLMQEKRCIGVIAMFARRALVPADSSALGTAATAIAVAISNVKYLQRAQDARAAAEGARVAAVEAAERTERLQALTASLAACRTEDDVATVVVDEVGALVGARTAALFRRTRDAVDVVIARQMGFDDTTRDSYARMPMHAETPATSTLRTGEPLFISGRGGADGLTARFPALTPVWTRMGTHALATVPLSVGDAVVGAMSFTFDTDRSFGTDDRDFFIAIGRQAAQAMERARLLDAERAARAEAEAANAAKSQFLGTMSHELRTPLNAIGGYSELISMGIHGPVTPAQLDHLGRIRRASQHLQSIINDILNFARLDAGTVSYDISTVSLSEVVAEASELIAPQAAQRDLTFDRTGCADAADNDVLRVRADAEKLRQVLVNLLTNAVKFTPPGGQVRMVCERHGTEARILVSDTGRGIAPDQLERIFEPFVQINRHLTQSSHQGVGLGLAISRDLARGMGGDLRAESTVDEGSTFTLTLPVAVDG